MNIKSEEEMTFWEKWERKKAVNFQENLVKLEKEEDDDFKFVL